MNVIDEYNCSVNNTCCNKNDRQSKQLGGVKHVVNLYFEFFKIAILNPELVEAFKKKVAK